MKFIVNKDEFVRDLSSADSIINVKSPLAVLLNVYMEAREDGTIVLLSFNGDQGVKVESDGVVEKAGKITLLSKKLLEVVRKIPGERVVIESVVEKTSVDIVENSTRIVVHPEGRKTPEFHLNGVSADAYPVFNEFDWKSYIKIPQSTLEEQVKATEFSVSQDIMKPAFTGTYIQEIVDGSLSFVASDGKSLSVITRSYEEKHGDVETDIIVPQRIFKTILNSFNKGDVLFSVLNDQVYFKSGNVYVFANLIDGVFPKNYKNIIPTEKQSVFEVQANEFLSALSTVSIMTDSDSNKVSLELKGSTLTLSAHHSVYGLATEEIEVEYSGEDISVSVNYKSLSSFLKFVSSKEIEMVINSKTSPLLLKAVGDDDYLYLTMPIKDFV